VAGKSSSRPYDSTRRRAQAELTRRDILAAAERLLARDGYARTTIASVAAEAGVATKTVYLAFATKSGLLRALWNSRLRGGEGEAPVAERPWFREVVEEPDPERRLQLAARRSREAKERIGSVIGVIREAAVIDADVAALWDRIETEFHANQRVIVDSLADAGALRPGLDAEEAADILWTLNHPDVWRALVGRRGWTPEQWESWFAATAISQLLRT